MKVVVFMHHGFIWRLFFSIDHFCFVGAALDLVEKLYYQLFVIFTLFADCVVVLSLCVSCCVRFCFSFSGFVFNIFS